MERKEKVKNISTLLDRVLIWCYTIYRTKEQRRPLGLMNSNDPKSGIAPSRGRRHIGRHMRNSFAEVAPSLRPNAQK